MNPLLVLCGVLAVCAITVGFVSAGVSRWAAARVRRGGTNRPSPIDLRGMTVNERLACMGLFPAWDAAFLARDRAKLIEIASRLQIDDPAFTVDTALSDPAEYGVP